MQTNVIIIGKDERVGFMLHNIQKRPPKESGPYIPVISENQPN